MSPAQRPDKYQVRKWQYERRGEKSPPPSPEQIRRELGWHLVPGNATKR